MAANDGGRSPQEQRKDHLQALETEAEGYRRRGLDDRVKEVQKQIDALTKNATPKKTTATKRGE